MVAASTGFIGDAYTASVPDSPVRMRTMESTWVTQILPDSDSLRVHIHGLRAAVDKPFAKALIQTRHGIGYRIAEPDAS